ncbi:MAG: biotin-independent malonate decarboxylase subunit beta [Pseudomonadota bacterium]
MSAAPEFHPRAGRSWLEATARTRVAELLDPGSFAEFLPPHQSAPSPHLLRLGVPGALDDGVVVGRGLLDSLPVLVAAQEGQFMGGAVGECHGAKIVGLLRRALADRPRAVLLLADSGGVRLHEANAGLVAISEIMRAVLEVRAAGVPVLCLIGGLCGAFGGMGIVARLCSAVIMSEEGRLSLSGPEVIETVAGVEEFDSRDRALVWRVTGGKHRYLIGDCDRLVRDDIVAFRAAAAELARAVAESAPTLARLRARQAALARRAERYAGMRDGAQVWQILGLTDPAALSMAEVEDFVRMTEQARAT